MAFELKDSIHFPKKETVRRIGIICCLCIGSFGGFISAGFDLAESTSASEMWESSIALLFALLSLVAVIFIQSQRIEKDKLSQAKESLKRLRAMVNDPSYIPLEVTILPAKKIDKIAFYLNGEIQRDVADKNGNTYKVYIKRLPYFNESAYLYCLNPDSSLFNPKQKYALVFKEQLEDSSVKVAG